MLYHIIKMAAPKIKMYFCGVKGHNYLTLLDLKVSYPNITIKYPDIKLTYYDFQL